MQRRASLAAAAGLLALALGTPARAEDPPPTFSASTTGSPVALAHGAWQQDGTTAARLRVEGAAAPSATTTFTAGWTSPFQYPPKGRAAFEYAYAINHARVTTGATVLTFEYRWRAERGKWSRWTTEQPDLAHEVLTSDGKGGGRGVAMPGKRPKIQWEWRLTGKLVGIDALALDVTVATPTA